MEMQRDNGRFVKKLTDNEVFAVFTEPNVWYSAGYVAKQLGVDRRTARVYLDGLVNSGSLKHLIVDGTNEIYAVRDAP